MTSLDGGAILHAIEDEVGGPIECLAPFELALTPDLPPGVVAPHFKGKGIVATTPTGQPTMMNGPDNHWGPCTAANDPSAACQEYIKTHGRSYVYVME